MFEFFSDLLNGKTSAGKRVSHGPKLRNLRYLWVASLLPFLAAVIFLFSVPAHAAGPDASASANPGWVTAVNEIFVDPVADRLALLVRSWARQVVRYAGIVPAGSPAVSDAASAGAVPAAPQVAGASVSAVPVQTAAAASAADIKAEVAAALQDDAQSRPVPRSGRAAGSSRSARP